MCLQIFAANLHWHRDDKVKPSIQMRKHKAADAASVAKLQLLCLQLTKLHDNNDHSAGNACSFTLLECIYVFEGRETIGLNSLRMERGEGLCYGFHWFEFCDSRFVFFRTLVAYHAPVESRRNRHNWINELRNAPCCMAINDLINCH